MEDEEEAKAFAEEIPAKKKKSVGFALDQNTVKEFDKTKKIVEVNDQQHYDEPKKSVSHENMDDMVSRTVKT
jgi:Potential Monad-binding region of RPAP3